MKADLEPAGCRRCSASCEMLDMDARSRQRRGRRFKRRDHGLRAAAVEVRERGCGRHGCGEVQPLRRLLPRRNATGRVPAGDSPDAGIHRETPPKPGFSPHRKSCQLWPWLPSLWIIAISGVMPMPPAIRIVCCAVLVELEVVARRIDPDAVADTKLLMDQNGSRRGCSASS